MSKIMGAKMGVIPKQTDSDDEVQHVRIDPTTEPHPHVQFDSKWYRVKWIFDIPMDRLEDRKIYEVAVKKADPKFHGHVELEDMSAFENPPEALLVSKEEGDGDENATSA